METSGLRGNIMETMRVTGVSCCGNRNLSRGFFRAHREGGVLAVELSAGSTPEEQPDWRAARRNADAEGICLWSMHLPFMPFEMLDIASTDRDLRRYTVDFLCELIRRGGEIGVPTFVVHPSGEPVSPALRSEMLDCSADSLARLAEVAGEVGGVIAVEDLPRTCLGNCSDEILTLLEADPRLGVCFDTNHLLGEPISDFVARVGKRIRTVHISDYDFTDEKHWMPGEGKIDWKELMGLLDAMEYRGVFLYELGLSSTNRITRSRDLTYADFRRNHIELESRLPLTRIL